MQSAEEECGIQDFDPMQGAEEECGTRGESRELQSVQLSTRRSLLFRIPKSSSAPCIGSKFRIQLASRPCLCSDPFGAALRYCAGHSTACPNSLAARSGQ